MAFKDLMKETDVIWLVHTDLLKQTLSEKLPEIVKDLGYKLRTYSGPIQTIDDIQNTFGFLDEYAGPIICYGHQKFIKSCMKFPYYPGYYPQDSEELRLLRPQVFMTKYYQQDLLNNDYILVPIADLIRNYAFYYDMFDQEKLFVKDNTAFKRFSARALHMAEAVEYLKLYKETHSINDESLVFLSSSKDNILSEHRFVVVDKKVAAHSTYRYNGITDIRIDVPQKALEFAERMAKIWQPCSAFTLDVAMIGTDLENAVPKMIELNSWSNAGLYACDLEKVVHAVSKQAYRDYQENQTI